MAIDTFDGKFPAPRRDEIRDQAIASHRARVPSIDGSSDSQLFVEASAYADVGVVHSYVATRCAHDMRRNTASTEALDELGAELDCPRLEASRSAGYGVVRSRSGGGTILAGAEARDLARGVKVTVIATGVYQDGDPVPIESVLTGSAQNLDAGTELRWTNTPVGFSDTLTIFENADGSGLVGGAERETNEEYNRRISDRIANPPQAGNCAEVVKQIEKNRGIGIGKAFCYPCIRGPGTWCAVVTMRPAVPGASRIPTGAQLATIEGALKDYFPGDDSIFVAALENDDIRISYAVTWAPAAVGWANLAPWPAFNAVNAVHVTNAVAISTSALRVTTTDTTTAPTVGKVIGLYNATRRTFVRKTIATVTQIVANKTYDLTFDMTTAGASDLTFVPANGAIVSPWSDSMADLVLPTLEYVDKQGPGEQVATLIDPGRRERRFPAPAPDRWPSRIDHRIEEAILALDSIEDAEVVEPTSLPAETTVGTAGTISKLHRVSDIGIFPQ